jgi:hypothetical protein
VGCNEVGMHGQRVVVQQKVVNGGGECLLDPDSTQPAIRQYWRHRAAFRLNSYQERTGDLAR